MTYKRHCSNWLLSFRDWTLPRSEAKESYIFWTGLFALSSALRRKVVVPKRYLGSWEAYPFIYVFFISPPGIGRKTTTISYTDDLLDEVSVVSTIAQAITQQDLAKRMADMSEPAVSIRSLEFGNFYRPSGDIMIDFLTAMFDGRRRYDSSTLARGYEFAAKPCVNLLAATTPKWINDNLSEGLVGGGFMSRVIPIYEDSVRRRQMFYEELDQKALDRLRTDLVVDLNHFAEHIEGEFKIDPDAKFFIEEWYKNTADKYEKGEDTRLQGYFERKPAYAYKLSMLLRIAYSDELIITTEDFQKALAVLGSIERRMTRVYSAAAGNPYTDEMDRITEFVNERGKVEKREILGRFYHDVPIEQLSQLLSALVAMEKIKIEAINPTKVFYCSLNHKNETPDLTKISAFRAADQAQKAPQPTSPQTTEQPPPGDS